MIPYQLTFTLESDAIFGRGDGLPGMVDREVMHDADGFPYLDGRSIKGMLSEECDLLLENLSAFQPDEKMADFYDARQQLFGQPGSRKQDRGILRFGQAQLPQAIRNALIANDVNPKDILNALTTIRRQTAMDEKSGTPADATLRSGRVILRQTHFEAQLIAERELSANEQSLLAASVLHWRRAGSLRNRGRGRLIADLSLEDGTSILKEGLEIGKATT